MAVKGYIRLEPAIDHTEALDLTTPSETLPIVTFAIASGTDADEMDLLWHDQRTTDATGEGLDLADGSLEDAFGGGCEFAEVRYLCIIASEDNTTNVIVGDSATNEWLTWLNPANSTMILPPGAMTANYCPSDGGWAVTSGSADELWIKSSSGSVTYDIYIGGVSA